MANIQDVKRNQYMLKGALRQKGYDWWWHSFTAYHEKTGKPQAFYMEIFLCNPAFGGDTPTFGQLGEKPSYMMVNCGIWGENAKQLHRFIAWNDVNVTNEPPFSVRADDCYLDETRFCGSITVTDAENHPEWLCDNGSISWNLKIDKKVAFHVGYGTCSLFRKLNAFEMYWHAQGMKTAYSGTITYNGENYIVRPEDCYGYADKNWGSDFTSPWVWLSSNNLTSNVTGKKLSDSVFDIGGGRPKVFGIALDRKLLSDFWYEGKSYEFNFSKFWTFTHTRFDCKETDTHTERCMDELGRIVLPADFRRALNIGKTGAVTLDAEDGRVLLRPIVYSCAKCGAIIPSGKKYRLCDNCVQQIRRNSGAEIAKVLYKDGRFHIDNVSFILPDNTYVSTVTEIELDNGMGIVSADQRVVVIVMGNEIAESAKESIESIFDAEVNQKKLSEIEEVTIAGLTGYKVMYAWTNMGKIIFTDVTQTELDEMIANWLPSDFNEWGAYALGRGYDGSAYKKETFGGVWVSDGNGGTVQIGSEDGYYCINDAID